MGEDDIPSDGPVPRKPAPQPLTEADAAAVMVMLLGEEQASGILAQLEPDALQLLGEKMVALGAIGPQAIVQAIAGFVEKTEALGMHDYGRMDQVRALMTRAVGPVKADSLMERIAPDAPPATALELARWLTPRAIAPLIRGEHPQAIAVLLVQLRPEVAAEVLHSLPAEQQTQVVHRVATLGPVAPEAIAMLEELLASRIAQFHGTAALSLGGPREAADIINASGKEAERRIMPEITRRDKQLARRIENEMFKFEHLFSLDAQSMGALLREVESDILINALKGIAADPREVFFAAMSSRAADGVRDEIAARGRLKMADVVEAQKAMVAIARRLAAEGVIAFGAGGDDEYV